MTCPDCGRTHVVEPSGFVPPGKASGPGTELSNLLSWFGAQKKPGCGCGTYASMMDRWGPDLCEKRIDVIVSWLVTSARRIKVPEMVAAPVARKAAMTAIERARKKQDGHNRSAK